MPTFTGFVNKATTTVWEMRSTANTGRDHFIAYSYLVEFIDACPVKIKTKLASLIKLINDKLSKLTGDPNTDINMTLATRSTEISQLLKWEEGKDLWSKLNDLLDKYGYKEQPSSRITGKDFKDLDKRWKKQDL